MMAAKHQIKFLLGPFFYILIMYNLNTIGAYVSKQRVAVTEVGGNVQKACKKCQIPIIQNVHPSFKTGIMKINSLKDQRLNTENLELLNTEPNE